MDHSSLSSRIKKLKLAGKYQRQRDLWLLFISFLVECGAHMLSEVFTAVFV